MGLAMSIMLFTPHAGRLMSKKFVYSDSDVKVVGSYCG